LKKGYLVKIIPPEGYAVHRIEFTRSNAMCAVAAAVLFVAAVAGLYVFRMYRAEASVRALRDVTASQQDELTRIDRQAQALGDQLQRIRVQNQQIRRLMGADTTAGQAHAAPPPPSPQRQSMRPADFGTVAARFARLQADSEHARRDGDRLRNMAMRVLNVRRLEDLARARLIAGIPSINPVPGTSIASAFGWRADPWPSFHQGVDLDADYGDEVHASAAGTVAYASWDGGYGLKVDIDHGNGYHTVYAHLSRVAVHEGDYVRKAQPIAEVGATGDATGPHLHYQVMYGGRAIDPTPFLNGVPPKVLASLR
jgi:murein DD-endopeptidase MepM/ murein hydrolase activator NlpD